MTKTRFKLLLLICPLVILIGIFLNFFFERRQIDKKLLNADGMIWETNEIQYNVTVIQKEEGELLHIEIKVVGPSSKEVFKTKETIDRDMFGGGFVRAAQVDYDPEKEIIIWHTHAKYYLDFAQGSVKKVSFDKVNQEIKDLSKKWHRYNVMAGLEMTLLILFILCYYTLFFLVKGVLKLFRRRRNGRS